MHFNRLGLHPALLAAVEASGYTEPTAVQAQAIPAALAGADLLVSSFTGSGKTAAFILPSLQRLSAEPAVKGNGPRILVLTPTRELAMQVEQAATTYGSKLNKRLRVACLVGGMPYPLQLRKLQGPVDIVIATPGRLIDHLERGRVDFKRLEVLVLDEADRMLDMGFIEDIEKIIAKTPATRQTLLFSATLDGVVGNMARRITREPKRIQIAPTAERKARIEQSALFADSLNHKTKLLDALLRDVDVKQALIFTSTKRAADDLSGSLREQGFSAQALHGDMNQTQRNRTLKGLVDGRTRVLVATDVAARGIDVSGISPLFIFTAPPFGSLPPRGPPPLPLIPRRSRRTLFTPPTQNPFPPKPLFLASRLSVDFYGPAEPPSPAVSVGKPGGFATATTAPRGGPFWRGPGWRGNPRSCRDSRPPSPAPPASPGLSSMMRVASEDTNSRSCDTKISVPVYLSSAVLSDSIDSMSRWLVGSSSSITLGICSTSLPKIMRCSSPPEITLTDFFVSSPENSSWPSVARTIWSSSPRSLRRQRPIQSTSDSSCGKSAACSCAQ